MVGIGIVSVTLSSHARQHDNSPQYHSSKPVAQNSGTGIIICYRDKMPWNSHYLLLIQLSQFLRIGFTLAALAITTQPFLPSLSAEPRSAGGSIMGAPDQTSEIDWWQINDDTGSEDWPVKDFPAKITATPRPPSSPASTSPGLKITDDGRFLVRNDGTPFFWLADSAQLLLYRLSREDVDLYLQHRASLGFTVIKTQIVSFLGINATNSLTAIQEDRMRLFGSTSITLSIK
jgi:hypothetical protein